MSDASNDVVLNKIVSGVVGLREDEALDRLLNANMKWRFLRVNHKTFPRPPDSVPNRVLLSVYENIITNAEIG